jgi:DNA excision repair protein ERCC-2
VRCLSHALRRAFADEAHNIDNVCIEALSVTLDRRTLDGAARNLGRLANEVKRMKETNMQRLQDEYARLASGLGLTSGGALGTAHASTSTNADAAAAAASSSSSSSSAVQAVQARDDDSARGGEELPGPPLLPTELAEQAIPGSIRNAELFVRFMRHVVRFLKDRIKVVQVESETPAAFLHRMGETLAVDPKPLRYSYSRLSSLLRTLEITDMDEFGPVSLVSDFATLLTTYPKGFMIILEPYNSKTPHIPDPIMQLACLDASLAVKPVFQKFQSVILTSGTLSPLEMYPKILNFNPVVRASFEMSLTRPCILPLMVTKGRDQTPLSTRFETRDDQNVMKNYGDMVVQLAKTVPDGAAVFFPSYAYMETIITAWNEWGVLEQIEAHKLLFIETKDIVATTLSLDSFRRACDSGRGAMFFSIARGKVAEGIDFDRHYGRLVVLIGVPFQYTLSHVLRARLGYMRDNYHIREQDFLTFDALRNSAQCVGRVIRSKRDYGVMVFADARYARHDKRSKLPLWVQQALSPAHLALAPDMASRVTSKFLRQMAQPIDPEAAIGTSLLTLEHVTALEAKRSSPAGTSTGAVFVSDSVTASAAAAAADAVTAEATAQARYPDGSATYRPAGAEEEEDRFAGLNGFLDDEDDDAVPHAEEPRAKRVKLVGLTE